jgi:hypothetical protein
MIIGNVFLCKLFLIQKLIIDFNTFYDLIKQVLIILKNFGFEYLNWLNNVNDFII